MSRACPQLHFPFSGCRRPGLSFSPGFVSRPLTALLPLSRGPSLRSESGQELDRTKSRELTEGEARLAATEGQLSAFERRTEAAMGVTTVRAKPVHTHAHTDTRTRNEAGSASSPLEA
jgi:hypothetical protein